MLFQRGGKITLLKRFRELLSKYDKQKDDIEFNDKTVELIGEMQKILGIKKSSINPN